MADDSRQSVTTETPSSSAPGQSTKRGHSSKAWIVFAVLLIVAAILVYFVAWLPREKQQHEIQQQARERTEAKPRVNVSVIRRAPATSALMIPGTTLAYTEADVYARASGYVTHRYADIGDRVRAGQVLATIDAPDLDQQVAQARSSLLESQNNLIQLQAQLHLNELNWERYKVLVAKGVFSRQQGDQQEANYRVAEANVRAAENTIQGNRENLNRLIVLQGYEKVTAPFSGVVTARNIDVGALISAQGSGMGTASSPSSPSTTLAGAQGNNQGASGNLSASTTPSTGGAQGGEMFGLAAIDRLRVLVSVPESYSPAIRIGQRAQLSFQAFSSEQYEGRVTRTSSSIDQNTRTLLVEVQVANPKGKLLPGMYTTVNFISIQGERPLLIPGEAIVVRNAKQMVALADNNVVHFQPILIGRDYGDQTEVLSGLKEGDVVVTDVSDEVHDGVQIDPQYPKQSSEAGGQGQQSGTSAGQYGPQSASNSSGKTGQPAQGKGSGASGQSTSGKQGSSASPEKK